jgi:hypothetical protein
MAEVISRERSATSPTTNKTGTYIEVPVQDTIPIIFFPGIMGSNLFNTEMKQSVWKLGNGAGILITVKNQMNKTPAILQQELDPENTIVDNNGTIKVDSRLKITEKVLRERGWGTVHWDSYGGVLTYLQLVLNNVDLNQKFEINGKGGQSGIHQLQKKEASFEWQSILTKGVTQQKWNPQNPLVQITQEEILHLKNFNFPVYAMGYNWLRSSEDAATLAVKKLDEIKKSLGKRFHKFIIVTHSMGGLVARRLAILKANDIAGVIHNVMPAEGAPLAYRRIVTGAGDAGTGASLVMGKSTEHMTAVLGNAPGGLELLPTKGYNQGKPWLFLKGSGHIVSLPSKGDPYEEIYEANGVWWEMVKEELLDPLKKSKESPKKVYNNKIKLVKIFHEEIESRYHVNTYVSYGHNEDQNSFGSVTWTLDKHVARFSAEQMKRLPRASHKDIENYNKKIVNDSLKKPESYKYVKENIKKNNGMRYVWLSNSTFGTFKISDPDVDGDGTVSFQSGRAPLSKPGVKQVFQMTGFNHQEGVANGYVKRSILYSIVKIIKDNNIQPKFK